MSLSNIINGESYKIAGITKYRTENISKEEIKEILTKKQIEILNSKEPETKVFFSEENNEYAFYYFINDVKLFALGIDEDRHELLVPFQE